MTALTEWTRAENYGGQTWYGWYLAPCILTRDSECIERSNWAAQWDALKPHIHEDDIRVSDNDGEDVPSVLIVRNGHWACGWLEFVAIHPSNAECMAIAEGLKAQLQDYPLLDEDSYSVMQWEEAEQYAA